MSVTRSTSTITNRNSIFYMTRNSAAMNTAYSKLALNQQVINLSDNPLAANMGIRMTNAIGQAQQYGRNIERTGIPALRQSSTSILDAKTLMDKVKTLTTGAANDPTERSANALELGSIMKQIISIANTTDGTRYIFGGHNTTNPPFTTVNGRYVNYTGNRGDINLIVDNNGKVPINVSGDEVFGNMTTTIPSKDMSPDVSLSTDHATPLADLNGGTGVPKGKITIKYSAYPEGLEVDLSGCDTLEDVKDTIEQATREASRNLNIRDHRWLDTSSLDWHDLQDRYVKVTVNPENNGISLQEFDLGEPLPEPTDVENYHGLTYSGGAYDAGHYGVAEPAAPLAPGEKVAPVTVHDKTRADGRLFAALAVEDYAGNKVATALGIKGTSHRFDPNDPLDIPDPLMDGFLHGTDLNPRLSKNTLLADIEGYNDSTYTFTNGSKPNDIIVRELGSADSGNVFDNWNLSGLTKNKNTGADGELYTRVVNRGTDANPEMYVEIYTRPVDKATAAHMVAAGHYTGDGTTVILEEVNNSGLTGTVGIHLPPTIKSASVELKADFGDVMQSSVHVPAFIEEQYENGLPKDVLGIASGWNIRGLDKPPAGDHDINHPASTDLEGDVSVNYRYDDSNSATGGYMYIELSRPSYGDQPAKHIATGRIYVGQPIPATGLPEAVSGRVEFVGEPGFEGVGGSVYIELPRGTTFSDTAASVVGDPSVDANNVVTGFNPTTVTYRLHEDAAYAPGCRMMFGGALEVREGMTIDGGFTLSDETAFLKGQVFDNDIRLPGGGVLPAGTPLMKDAKLPKGTLVVPAGGVIVPGTVLAANQQLTVTALPAETVIPRGSYSMDAGQGFPAGGMSLANNGTAMAGYDVRATFATVEDLQRAVREAGVYVDVQINDRGTGLEFASTLAGAWLTVSEDTDCYEQMGDRNQQLTGLNLTGLVKGVNADVDGNAYTEVIYYPPDPLHPDDKITLHDKDGKVIEIDPGYYVRVYSDRAQMDLPYADRDNTKMVAEGFVPAGEWDGIDAATAGFYDDKAVLEADAITAYEQYLANLDADPNISPDDPRYLEPWDLWRRDTSVDHSTIPSPDLTPVPIFSPADAGIMRNLVLEERNNSGVSGTVNLDYHGSRDQTAHLTYHVNSNGEREYTFDYSPDDNENITLYPGGFRQMTGKHMTVQEMDLYDPMAGVNCDASGVVHGKVTTVPGTTNRVVELYRDSSHSVMTARSDPAAGIGPHGEVTLYNVDRHGNFLDKAGNVLDITTHPLDQYGVVVGTMTVDAANLPAGEDETFTLATGAARNTGQEREENIFSTINDIIDAMNHDDAEALHDLLEDAQRDIDRALKAEAVVSARWQRLELLQQRHKDDVIKFNDIWTKNVGMDEEAYIMGIMDYQSAMQALNAAMQATSQTMNVSLLNYI